MGVGVPERRQLGFQSGQTAARAELLSAKLGRMATARIRTRSTARANRADGRCAAGVGLRLDAVR
jgi:hypothetical protein